MTIRDTTDRINFMMDYDTRNQYRPLMKQQPIRQVTASDFIDKAESAWFMMESVAPEHKEYHETIMWKNLLWAAIAEQGE